MTFKPQLYQYLFIEVYVNRELPQPLTAVISKLAKKVDQKLEESLGLAVILSIECRKERSSSSSCLLKKVRPMKTLHIACIHLCVGHQALSCVLAWQNDLLHPILSAGAPMMWERRRLGEA